MAHPNIALIKYWGKSDARLNLPKSPSISLTLDGFKTSTSVTVKRHLKEDVFILNGKEIQNDKINTLMDQVRHLADVPFHAVIETANNFPTSAGYASSASGMAALSVACNKAYRLNLDHDGIAQLARIGSGSATRSIDGGLVTWQPGSDKSSFGKQILPPEKVPIAVLSITTTSNQKSISSTSAMKVVSNNSPFYDAWIQSSTIDFENALNCIQNEKWEKLLEISEHNAMKMHATTISAKPAIFYFEPETIQIIKLITKIRQEKKLSVYCSIDAGPNVKILTFQSQLDSVMRELQSWHPEVSLPGKGARIIE